jgi:hypothetical protein
MVRSEWGREGRKPEKWEEQAGEWRGEPNQEQDRRVNKEQSEGVSGCVGTCPCSLVGFWKPEKSGFSGARML